MTYEKKAENESRRRLTKTTVAAMRGRRASGDKLSAIAEDFGVSEACVHYHCRDVAPDVGAVDPSPVATEIVRVVGEQLGLAGEDWHRNWGRGQPPTLRLLGKRASILAMRAANVPTCEMAAVFGLPRWKITSAIRPAAADPRARDVAQAALAAAQARDIETPAPNQAA